MIDTFLAHEAFRICLKLYEQKTPTRQLLDTYLNDTFSLEAEQVFDAEQLEDAKCVLNSFKNYVRLDQGASPLDQRMPPAEGYKDFEGGIFPVAGQMSKLVELLVERLPKQMIKLGREVTQIKWGKHNKIQVTCQSRQSVEQYSADHVIVTCSLGYLKENHSSLFIPHLPRSKVTAIEKIGFGKVGKIFLEYEQPFWRELTGCSGKMAVAWTDTDYVEKSKHDWWKRIHVLHELPQNPNVLQCWLACEGAEVAETLPEAEVINTVTTLLRKWLGNPSVPRARRCLVSRWCSDRFSRGVYSYMSSETRPSHMDDLALPLVVGGIPLVLFAGEATINSGHAYMHGARDSGLREAQRIMKMYAPSYAHISKL